MKKILFIAFVLLLSSTKAQFTLEHIYDSASVYNTCAGEVEQLLVVDFEVSGNQYVKINRCGQVIDVYNMSHSLVKTITLTSMLSSHPMGDVLYLSQHLFNTDSLIEFMFTLPPNYTGIYNENGVLLFSDTSAPLIHVNYPLQQYPIYNTSVGTKMILSCRNGQAKVFGLAGTLTTAIDRSSHTFAGNMGMPTQTPRQVPLPYPTHYHRAPTAARWCFITHKAQR